MSTKPLVTQARFLAGAKRIAELPPPALAELAFAGRSNVGKSSLMNNLMGRRNLVRTSSTPGCTRQLGFFEALTADGAALCLVDLPGYGYARRSKAERSEWGDLIEGYLLGRVTLRAVVILVDVRRGLEEDDRDLIELCSGPARVERPALSTLIVATKLDKLPKNQQKLRLEELKRSVKLPLFGVSSKDGSGREPLFRALRAAAGLAKTPEQSSG